MNDAQKKAWDCLNEIERQSLFLQLSESKSSWEAGEILKLSHYKYLEIRERSEKFFRLFSDFLSYTLLFFDLTALANEAFVILLKDVLKRD